MSGGGSFGWLNKPFRDSAIQPARLRRRPTPPTASISSVLETIGNEVGGDTFASLGQAVRASPQQTESVVGAALPAIITGLARRLDERRRSPVGRCPRSRAHAELDGPAWPSGRPASRRRQLRRRRFARRTLAGGARHDGGRRPARKAASRRRSRAQQSSATSSAGVASRSPTMRPRPAMLSTR